MQFVIGRKASAEHGVVGIPVVVEVVGSSAGSRVGTCEGAVVVRTHVGTGTGRGEGTRETVGNGCVDVVDVDVGVRERDGGAALGGGVGAEPGGGRKVVVVAFGAGVGTGTGRGVRPVGVVVGVGVGTGTGRGARGVGTAVVGVVVGVGVGTGMGRATGCPNRPSLIFASTASP